jgi:hypothetical protein
VRVEPARVEIDAVFPSAHDTQTLIDGD